MSSSYGMYSACYAGAESYDAFEAQAQYAQSFWSPAGQPAFHNYQMFTQYPEDQVSMNAWSQPQAYNSQSGENGKQAAMQCGVNLDDYSDFSDTDSESNPSTPTATVVMSKDLHKSLSEGQIADDSNSTDVASSTLSDAASIANVSDESDVDSDSCPSPKASKRVYSIDSMLLIRMAVGMCSSPPVKWSTQPVKKASASGDGCEWRREAADQQRGSVSTKLVASATSWAAQQKLAHSQANTPSATDQEVTRSVKSILNKLTIEKFDALYAKLITCGISKDQHVELLVQEVFEKACLQHHFIDMYADLCLKLEKSLDDNKTDATASGFRRILLNQCQKSFEDSLQAPVKVDQEMAEDERLELETRHKQRVLGNTRLIGALLTRGMLSPRVLIFCANELLKDPAAPDALESLAALLTAVGPTFDDEEWSSHGLLCSIFDRVKALTKDKQVAPRLRFLLVDVLDLRATNWANMKKVTAKPTGPMKLEEVQKQAAEEEAQAQKKSNSRNNQSGLKKNSATTCEPKQTGSPKQKQGADEPKAKSQRSPKKAPTTPESSANLSGKKALNKQPLSPKVVPSPIVASPKVVPAPVAASPKSSSTESSPRTGPFDLRAFRRELTDVMKELGATRDTARARRRFDGLKVPSHLQASEFSNLLTRVAEERCSATRRAMFAFVAGLAGSVFDKDKCADGIKSFFDDVFDDLCEEVPRLPEILRTELVPTIRAALPAGSLSKILPAALK